MSDKIFGLDTSTFNVLILLLLLIILGIVSFNYYLFLSANNGIDFGTGVGFSLFPNYRRNGQRPVRVGQTMANGQMTGGPMVGQTIANH